MAEISDAGTASLRVWSISEANFVTFRLNRRSTEMVTVRRWRICGIILAIVVVGTVQADEWREVSRGPNITVFTRHRVGSVIDEVRAVSKFDVPIQVLREVLADVQRYPEFMPYTKEFRALPQDEHLYYLLIAPPLLEPRDCTVRVHREIQRTGDGQSNYYAHWEQANDEGPTQRPGIVRMTVNDGSWLLEPVENATRATCTMCTDDGNMAPQLANMLNRLGIVRVFDALRLRVYDRQVGMAAKSVR